MGYDFKEIFSETTKSPDGLCEVWTRVYYARVYRILFESIVYRKKSPSDEEPTRDLVLRAYETKHQDATCGENVRFAIGLHENFVHEQFAKAVFHSPIGTVSVDRNGVGMSQPGLVDVAEAVVEACARAAHEVNRAYCLALGDASQPPWEEAPDWQTTSARSGARGALAGATPEQSHRGWLTEKRATCWKLGPVKNPEEKEHPCLVPYAELPESQRAKDDLFVTTVRAVARALDAVARPAHASEEPCTPHRARASDALSALNRITATAAITGLASSVLDEIRTVATFIAETELKGLLAIIRTFSPKGKE